MRTPILACFLSLTLFAAAEDESHPIDRFYESCIEKNGSTAGMIDCTEKSYQKWDAELNRVYGELLKKLPAAKVAEFKKSQRDWLAYRDSEFKAIDGLYSGLQGTMYLPAHVYARLAVVRERTLTLTHYLELLKDAGE